MNDTLEMHKLVLFSLRLTDLFSFFTQAFYAKIEFDYHIWEAGGLVALRYTKCYSKTEVDINYYIFIKDSCFYLPTSVGTFNLKSPIESPLEIILTKIHVSPSKQTNKNSARKRY